MKTTIATLAILTAAAGCEMKESKADKPDEPAVVSEPEQPWLKKRALHAAFLMSQEGVPYFCHEATADDAEGLSKALTEQGSTLEEIKANYLKSKEGLDVSEVSTCPRDGVMGSCKMKTGEVVMVIYTGKAYAIRDACLANPDKFEWEQSNTLNAAIAAAKAAIAAAEAAKPIEVSAAELHKAYSENEVKADAQYKGRDILLTGKVTKIEKDFMGDPYIGLASGQRFQDVLVYDLPVEVAINMNKGQTVSLNCRVSGRTLGNVHLNCSP